MANYYSQIDVKTTCNCYIYFIDHGFYRKWAILTDLQDINGGAKGYLKVDIVVLAKGDSTKPAKKASDKDDDIES